MNESAIRIKQYEQAADEKVSLGGIKWEQKWDVCVKCDSREEAERVRAALTAQPEQEPVAWMFQHEETGRTMCVDAQQVEWGFEKGNPRLKKIAPLYTSPPASKPWVGLTDDEIAVICGECAASAHRTDDISYARAIEAKLKEKNA